MSTDPLPVRNPAEAGTRCRAWGRAALVVICFISSSLAATVCSAWQELSRIDSQGTVTPGGVMWAAVPASQQGQAVIPANDDAMSTAAGPVSYEQPSRVPPAPGNAMPAQPKSASSGQSVGTTEFLMAAQPVFGAHARQAPVQVDDRVIPVPGEVFDFAPTPTGECDSYEPGENIWVYEGKTLNANRRPLLELGRPWYQLGQIPKSPTYLGKANPMSPHLIAYGDFRMAGAANQLGGNATSLIAAQWNINFDLKLTSTERIVAFMAPFDDGGLNTRWLLDDNEFAEEFDADFDFAHFEGDLGAIVGGATGQTLPFDFPFAVGVMPLLFQNGVWMEDAVLGAAFTIPARNSAALDISNMDITFFAAYDNINSDAFPGDNDVAKMYGMASFIETLGGYIEADYAFLEDRDRLCDRSYHNIGLAYSRRYGRFISNSVRLIVNAGQSSAVAPNTADGVLVLIENSLITSNPSTFVPYFNLFAGFDRPQSAARAGAAGGVLRNTGILFESDNMTGYPTLDPTANETFGGAVGLNIISTNFDQQLVLEIAALQVMGSDAGRRAAGDQYGAGMRYQLPLSNSWILRSDAMYGCLRNADDVHGVRLELRHKF